MFTSNDNKTSYVSHPGFTWTTFFQLSGFSLEFGFILGQQLYKSITLHIDNVFN
jgi:hypothetical protein